MTLVEMAVKPSCKSASITVPISQIIYLAFKKMSSLIHILLKQEDMVPATEAVTLCESSGVNHQPVTQSTQHGKSRGWRCLPVEQGLRVS